MKRVCAVLLVLILALAEVAVCQDYFPDLTVDELLELKRQIEESIEYKTSNSSNEDYGMWEKRYYVDMFKNPTDIPYITPAHFIHGTFNNSVATNEDLGIDFVIDSKTVKMYIYEYGYAQVKNTKKDTTYYYDMFIQDESGNQTRIIWDLKPGEDKLYLHKEEDMATFINLLKDNLKLSFYMSIEGSSFDEYYFSIENTLFFEAAYSELVDVQE
jgi:hypothetical protein